MRPARVAAATSGATAPASRWANGSSGSSPWSRYGPIIPRLASSRLNPNTIWVRSLVPNEKKSAWVARSDASRAALGVSIMAPTGTGSFTPQPSTSSSTHPRTRASSAAVDTMGSMTAAWAWDPAAAASSSAPSSARTCIR